MARKNAFGMIPSGLGTDEDEDEELAWALANDWDIDEYGNDPLLEYEEINEEDPDAIDEYGNDPLLEYVDAPAPVPVLAPPRIISPPPQGVDPNLPLDQIYDAPVRQPRQAAPRPVMRRGQDPEAMQAARDAAAAEQAAAIEEILNPGGFLPGMGPEDLQEQIDADEAMNQERARLRVDPEDLESPPVGGIPDAEVPYSEIDEAINQAEPTPESQSWMDRFLAEQARRRAARENVVQPGEEAYVSPDMADVFADEGDDGGAGFVDPNMPLDEIYGGGGGLPLGMSPEEVQEQIDAALSEFDGGNGVDPPPEVEEYLRQQGLLDEARRLRVDPEDLDAIDQYGNDPLLEGGDPYILSEQPPETITGSGVGRDGIQVSPEVHGNIADAVAGNWDIAESGYDPLLEEDDGGAGFVDPNMPLDDIYGQDAGDDADRQKAAALAGLTSDEADRLTPDEVAGILSGDPDWRRSDVDPNIPLDDIYGQDAGDGGDGADGGEDGDGEQGDGVDVVAGDGQLADYWSVIDSLQRGDPDAVQGARALLDRLEAAKENVWQGLSGADPAHGNIAATRLENINAQIDRLKTNWDTYITGQQESAASARQVEQMRRMTQPGGLFPEYQGFESELIALRTADPVLFRSMYTNRYDQRENRRVRERVATQLANFFPDFDASNLQGLPIEVMLSLLTRQDRAAQRGSFRSPRGLMAQPLQRVE